MLGSLVTLAAVALGALVLGVLGGQYTRSRRAAARGFHPGHQDEAQRTGEQAAGRSESDAMLREARSQLARVAAELAAARQQIRELADQREAELGRLESGAITALESTIATHREHVAQLEEKLHAAEAAGQENVRQLAVERGRSARLQSVLAERDQHIAALAGKQA